MKLRFIVAGFGFMGQTHAGNLLKHPAAELCGIVDPVSPQEQLKNVRGNQATVTITAKDIEAIPHFRDLKQALIALKPDAAVLPLPTKLHYMGVMLCLKHGCHVLVEKPFSTDMIECHEMCCAAAATGKKLCVGYTVRYMHEYIALFDTIKSGRLGPLEFLSLTRFTGMPTWGAWSDPQFIKASGGALFDLLSHDFDFTRHCLGEPSAIEVNETIRKQFGNNRVSVILKYDGGPNVQIEGGFVQPPTFTFRRSYSAFFEKGTLATDMQGKYQEFTAAGVKEFECPQGSPYYAELDDFIRVLRNEKTAHICNGTDAEGTIALCHKIKASATA